MGKLLAGGDILGGKLQPPILIEGECHINGGTFRQTGIQFHFCFTEQVALIQLCDHVVDIVEVNGKTLYITQGDKVAEMNDTYKYNADRDWDGTLGLSNEKCELVGADEIRGIYTGKWNGFGKAFKFLQTSNGFLLCVVLPIALFFVIELLLLVLNFMKIKQQKRDEQHAEDMERIKQEQQAQLEAEKARIRAEILAEQAQKEKEEENKNE